jgi:hypothetical protein
MARPGEVTIVLWSWPEGENLSHRGQFWTPRRDVGHPLQKHRFVCDVPESLADEIVALVPLAKRRE